MTAEALAVKALREYLLANLPARVAAINAANVAQLVAARPGPYVVPASGALLVGTSRGTTTTNSLTAGSRTAAEVAAEILTSGITATADSLGRLVLTSTTAPALGATVASDTPSVVAVGAHATCNALFGWDAGGESVVTSPLRAPNHKHLRDGWMTRAPDGAAGCMWVVLGDRQTTLAPDAKHQRDEYLVEVSVDVLVPSYSGEERTRERITNAVRAVREVLTGGGRGLGGFNQGVLLCRLLRTRIAGMPFGFESGSTPPNQLFDAAHLTVGIRVFVAPVT